MSSVTRYWIAGLLMALVAPIQAPAQAQTAQQVVDIPTRPGVTQRILVLSPPAPKAAVVLIAGGHGGLQIFPNGSFRWGAGNFLVRTRQLFADQGLMVAVIDAPSDRQRPPYLAGFRQKPEHAADLRAVIAWMRQQSGAPVWLVGTSRGTQSAAYAATELSGPERSGGPDGIVLSSTILTDNSSRPVPAMPLEKIRIPVLVVHHEQDGCALCAFANVPAFMDRFVNAPRKELLVVTGGQNQGDPCEAMAYHGFNGLDPEVVQQIAGRILAR
jgi:dienelactone hydrolase